MMVPTPTMMSSTSAMMARTASSAAGVRSVISIDVQAAGQQRPGQRHSVGGASIVTTGMTGLVISGVGSDSSIAHFAA